MEVAIVIVIVAAAVGYLWRTIARGVKNDAPSCGCGGCDGCPAAGRGRSQGKARR
jgi:hypothetical protein